MDTVIAKGVLCASLIASVTGAAVADPYSIPDQVQYQAKYQEVGGVSPGVWDVSKTFNDDNGRPLGAPSWDIVGEPVRADLVIPNLRMEYNVKNVYLLLTYDTDSWDETAPELTISAPGLSVLPQLVFSDASLGSGQVFYHWRLTPQPANETIHWADLEGYDLTNGLECIEVGTWCIPTPSGVAVLGIAALPLTRRRR